jgi:hypothetical protein
MSHLDSLSAFPMTRAGADKALRMPLYALPEHRDLIFVNLIWINGQALSPNQDGSQVNK